MLLDKLGTIRYTTRNKVLPTEGSLPKFETTGEGSGTLMEVDVNAMATYQGAMGADGFIYGECPNSGVVIADDGVATFRATGIGAFTDEGGSSWKGVAYFQAASPSLESLNGVAVAYSWDVDADGHATWELWALR